METVARIPSEAAASQLVAAPSHTKIGSGATDHGAVPPAGIDTSPRIAAQRQRMDSLSESTRAEAIQAKATSRAERPNENGLPAQLKAGIESLSGMDLAAVRVHRNSGKPAQLQAHAYAHGNDIHLGPGQERHLPHEAWHVVQQAQGRVRPTLQMAGGVSVNDDRALEREADLMGAQALRVGQLQQKDGTAGALDLSPLLRRSGPSMQLQAASPVYQLNGKEKAVIGLVAFAGGALLTWLWGKWDEKTALQKQQAIIEDFEHRMQAEEFRTHKEDRENLFVLAALKEGVAESVARRLFRESGAAAKDTVTGFDMAADRKPTIQNAIDYIKNNSTATGFYVEVDIRNLGGLNAVLGHTGADGVFAELSRLTEDNVRQLEGGAVKVARFRHGGDEFSFVVFSSDGSIAKKDVELKLMRASDAIARYVDETRIAAINTEAEDKLATLRSIEHPKHKGDHRYNGTGIVFGVSGILGTDSVGNVTAAADLEVEQKKTI